MPPVERRLREEREVLLRDRVAAVRDGEREPRSEDVRIEVDVELRARQRQADERRRAGVGAHPHRLRERRRRRRPRRTRTRRRALRSAREPPRRDRRPMRRRRRSPRARGRGRASPGRRRRRRSAPRRRSRAPCIDGEPDAAAADHRDGGALRAPASPRERLRRRSRSRTRAAWPARSAARRAPSPRTASCTTACVGERAAAEHRRQQRAVRPPGATRRLARSCEEQRRGSPRRHCGHSPHGARHAMTTRSPGATDRHVAAHLLHDPGALVAEQDREPRAPALRLDDVQVGVAEPAGLDADEHLARAGRIDGQLLDRRAASGSA